MTTREQIVEEARSWLGTPFHHQGRVKGVGVDCAGVVVCTARNLDIEHADVVGYPHVPSKGQFLATVQSATDKIELNEIQPADLMVFAFDSEPQHIAIVSSIDPIMLIHAWAQARKCVETRLDDLWMSRLRGCYRFRGIA